MISNSDVRIRIDVSSIRFPSTCPFCKEQAEKHRVISKTKKDRIKQATNPQYRRWRRTPFPIPTQRFSLDIPVCNNHYKTSRDVQLSRSMNGLIAGLFAPFSIILSIFLGFNWYDGILLPFPYYLLWILSWFTFFWSVRNLGATDLERAISILDWVQGNPAILIRVREGWYADEILKSNPSAKIVRRKQ